MACRAAGAGRHTAFAQLLWFSDMLCEPAGVGIPTLVWKNAWPVRKGLNMFETEPKHTRENTTLVVVVLVTLALLLVVGYLYFIS